MTHPATITDAERLGSMTTVSRNLSEATSLLRRVLESRECPGDGMALLKLVHAIDEYDEMAFLQLHTFIDQLAAARNPPETTE